MLGEKIFCLHDIKYINIYNIYTTSLENYNTPTAVVAMNYKNTPLMVMVFIHHFSPQYYFD